MALKNQLRKGERGDELDLDNLQIDFDAVEAGGVDMMFSEQAIEFDKAHPPIGQKEKLLSRAEMYEAIDNLWHSAPAKEDRLEPHDRLVIITHKDEPVEDTLQKDRQDFLREPKEAEIALVNQDNQIEGKLPAHVYMSYMSNYMSIGKLIDMVNYENMSMDHPGIPEASYCLIEDGDLKGEYTFSGSMQDVDEHVKHMTIRDFGNRDRDNEVEVWNSAEKDAEKSEKEEELADKAYAMDSDEPKGLSWREMVELGDDFDEPMERLLGGGN